MVRSRAVTPEQYIRGYETVKGLRAVAARMGGSSRSVPRPKR